MEYIEIYYIKYHNGKINSRTIEVTEIFYIINKLTNPSLIKIKIPTELQIYVLASTDNSFSLFLLSNFSKLSYINIIYWTFLLFLRFSYTIWWGVSIPKDWLTVKLKENTPWLPHIRKCWYQCNQRSRIKLIYYSGIWYIDYVPKKKAGS